MKTLITSLMAVMLLTACDGKGLEFKQTPLVAKRFYADQFQDAPFDTGPITVLATEHRELRSYTLRPCGGDHICGAHKGHVVKTPDYWIVSGAYAGRVFYVSHGGDGWVKRDGGLHPMAWN